MCKTPGPHAAPGRERHNRRTRATESFEAAGGGRQIIEASVRHAASQRRADVVSRWPMGYSHSDMLLLLLCFVFTF